MHARRHQHHCRQHCHPLHRISPWECGPGPAAAAQPSATIHRRYATRPCQDALRPPSAVRKLIESAPEGLQEVPADAQSRRLIAMRGTGSSCCWACLILAWGQTPAGFRPISLLGSKPVPDGRPERHRRRLDDGRPVEGASVSLRRPTRRHRTFSVPRMVTDVEGPLRVPRSAAGEQLLHRRLALRLRVDALRLGGPRRVLGAARHRAHQPGRRSVARRHQGLALPAGRDQRTRRRRARRAGRRHRRSACSRSA